MSSVQSWQLADLSPGSGPLAGLADPAFSSHICRIWISRVGPGLYTSVRWPDLLGYVVPGRFLFSRPDLAGYKRPADFNCMWRPGLGPPRTWASSNLGLLRCEIGAIPGLWHA